MRARRLAGLLTVAVSLAAPMTARGLHAQVTVGAEQLGLFTCGPFTCNLGQTRYQQVYDATAFGGAPLEITSVQFQRGMQAGVPLSLPTGTYTLSMSITSKAVGALSLDFAENVTSPQSLFAVEVDPSVQGGQFIRFVGTPFYYDPALGNLLLDWSLAFSGPYIGGCGCLAGTPTGTSAVANRDPVYNLATPYSTRSGALTTFNATSTVPEPSTYLLLGSGLVVLGALARRQRAVA